jgi:hypothetical protein
MESSPLPAAIAIVRSVRAMPASKWLACAPGELLPVSYVHVVFTLPHELARSRCRTRS